MDGPKGSSITSLVRTSHAKSLDDLPMT